MPFCWKCGVYLDKTAKYCFKCGTTIGSNIKRADLNFFNNKKHFIIQSKLRNSKKMGKILDSNMNIIACYDYGYNLKPPYKANLYYAHKKKAWAFDLWLETFDGAFAGEIVGFGPPVFSKKLRFVWEIFNSKNKLEGRVWEKIRGFFKSGSNWYLENPTGKTIAMFKGDRKRKNYIIVNDEELIVARCYRNPKMNKNSYLIDIIRSSIDNFLVLCYILVLDHAKRYPVNIFP